ncbi:3682_t:CDS:1, partial [Diversispora eburnea]
STLAVAKVSILFIREREKSKIKDVLIRLIDKESWALLLTYITKKKKN